MTQITTEVTETTFVEQVLEASEARPVVVDFWADWCGPCRQLSPLLDRVGSRYAGEVDLVKVDVDAAPNLARQYRIQGIPAVKAFRHGKVAAEFTGLQPEQVVERFFAALLPTPADRLVAEAAESDPAAAERLLREALETDASHAGAIVALARLLADRGEPEEALQIARRAPGDPDAQRLVAELSLAAGKVTADGLSSLRAAAQQGDAGSRLRLGKALAAQGAHPEAIEVLLGAVGHPETREEARAAVLQLFAVLGNEHELVRTARPRLASALFA